MQGELRKTPLELHMASMITVKVVLATLLLLAGSLYSQSAADASSKSAHHISAHLSTTTMYCSLIDRSFIQLRCLPRNGLQTYDDPLNLLRIAWFRSNCFHSPRIPCRYEDSLEGAGGPHSLLDLHWDPPSESPSSSSSRNANSYTMSANCTPVHVFLIVWRD